MPINPDLKKALEQAKKRTRDSKNRIYFTMVLISESDGTLLAGKKKASFKEVDEVKKKINGTAVVRGTCFADGDKLVFECQHAPHHSWNKMVKKLVHQETGLMVDPDFQVGQPPEKRQQPFSSPPPIPLNHLIEEFKKRLYLVEVLYKQFLEIASKKEGKLEQRRHVALSKDHRNAIRSQMASAVALAKEQKFGEALQQIGIAEQWVKRAVEEFSSPPQLKMQQTPPQPPSHESIFQHEISRFNSRFNDRYKQLKEKDPELADKLRSQVQQLGLHGDEGRFEQAVQLMRQVDFAMEYPKFQKRFQALQNKIGTRADHLKSQVEQVGNLGDNGEYEKALQLLGRVDKLIAHSAETTAWREEIGHGLDEGKYKLGKFLTQEGQGALYVLSSDEPNAKSLIAKSIKYEDFAGTGMTDIEYEAKKYEEVGDHPNIARCFGVRQVGGKKVLVMEQIDGDNLHGTLGTLQSRYNARRISPEQYWSAVRYILSKTLQALAHVHQMGIVHNDVKPKNIMIDRKTGAVKLIDLGIAFQSGQELVKKPDPFTDLRNPSDSQTDVFSVGAIGKRASNAPPKTLIGLKKDLENEQPKPNDPNQLFTEFLKNQGKGTAYEDFVRNLLEPDKDDRLLANDALQLPFLNDSNLDEHVAESVLTEVLNSDTPTAGTYTLAFMGKSTGAIPWNASAHMVHQALEPILKLAHTDKGDYEANTLKVEGPDGGPFTVTFSLVQSDNDEEDGVEIRVQRTSYNLVQDATNLIPRGSFVNFKEMTADSTITPFSEKFDTNHIEIKVKITPGFNRKCWEQTMTDAVSCGAVPEASGMIQIVSEALTVVDDFRSYSRQTMWGNGTETFNRVFEAFVQIRNTILKLLEKKVGQGRPYFDHPQIHDYLFAFFKEAGTRNGQFNELFESVAPRITTAKFKATWKSIKAEADKGFSHARKALLNLIWDTAEKYKSQLSKDITPKMIVESKVEHLGLEATTAQEYFSLWDDFSVALEEFETAVSRKTKNTEKEREKALMIGRKYVNNIEKSRGFSGEEPHFGTIGATFRQRLLRKLDDLIHSIELKK